MNLTNPIFTDADKARLHLQAIRWPNGPICPKCGEVGKAKELEGASHRPGLFKCYSCDAHFTVTVGTVFERSKVPLNKWVLASHLIAASKKGYSAHQLHRTLEVSYKTAWFMMHRLREAMTIAAKGPIGGGGKTVEADETYWGNSHQSKKGKAAKESGVHYGGDHKEKIISLVERDGQVRSFHVPKVNGATLKSVLHGHVAKDSHLMTDELRMYRRIGRDFMSHQTVNHSAKEYARGSVTTNTVEGYFSILKRGLVGTYHHVSAQHLQRYVEEFDFRYNTRTSLGFTDTERATMLLKNSSGKRLTYY